MSRKERNRLTIMNGIQGQELTLVQAAALLGLSYRQTQRVWGRYQAEGDAGLVHRLRGQPSARRKPSARRAQFMASSRFQPWKISLQMANFIIGSGRPRSPPAGPSFRCLVCQPEPG